MGYSKKINEITVYGGPVIVENLVFEIIAKINEIIKVLNNQKQNNNEK